jgi:hypothetical protein
MSGQQGRHSSASAERRRPPEPWRVTQVGEASRFAIFGTKQTETVGLRRIACPPPLGSDGSLALPRMRRSPSVPWDTSSGG